MFSVYCFFLLPNLKVFFSDTPGQKVREDFFETFLRFQPGGLRALDGRNRTIIIAESESYRCDSNRWRLLSVVSSPETQKSVLTDPAFVVLLFESHDWRSFV